MEKIILCDRFVTDGWYNTRIDNCIVHEISDNLHNEKINLDSSAVRSRVRYI